MRITHAAMVPLLALLACGDESNNEKACEPNEDTFVPLFNANGVFWSTGSYCDEIYFCADATTAQMLIEQLDLECQVETGSNGCNFEGQLKCYLATEAQVTEQDVADACTALEEPALDEVFCAKF